MKKVLTIAFVAILCMSLAACNKKEENLVGGYTTVEDGTLNDELLEIFNKALEGYTGMKLEPVELLQTQIVAGKNFRFLANGTAVVPDAKTEKKIVTVYQDLEGNCTITDVEDYKD